MGLYLGSNKMHININEIIYAVNLFSDPPITNGIRLLSVDNDILKDSNGLYLTTKEGE